MELHRFDDIENVGLRVYNRLVMLFNINEDSGKDAAEAYLDQFDKGEKKQLYIMSAALKKYGKDELLKIVTKDLELPPEEDAA